MSADSTTTAAATAKAAELLKNAQFLELFQRALAGGGGDGGGDAKGTAASATLLQDMPPEGDPRRDAWLRELQARLQAEAMKETKQQLEQVQSDEQGQWMYILPTPGFCIKCTVAGGGKVFINVCQHERIGEPTPLQPEHVTSTTSSNGKKSATMGGDDGDEVRFRIPISCGAARADTDKSGRPCKVYDVVVNPTTVARCAQEKPFRRFVAALCMQWIQQKSEPSLNVDEFRNVNFNVKGTLEPQRIRLSHAPKTTNAMRDEIALPTRRDAATAPRHVGGTRGDGKLIEEVQTPATAATAAVAPPRAASDAHAQDDPSDSAVAAAQPAVVHVTPEGAYDWSTHAKPMANVYFRDTAVPASYRVELYLPNVQTARDVDVRVSSRRLSCYKAACDTANDDDNDDAAANATAAPFLVVTFDYPVSDVVQEARFVKKTSRLRLRCVVRLPDETAPPATRPARDADDEEREAAQRAVAAQEAAAAAARAARERAAAEEARVMRERKALVANVAAMQTGTLPPAVREEVDSMPREQLPALLMRLEGRVRRGDAVDALLDKLPEAALEELCAHVRERLSLQPRPATTTATAATTTTTAATAAAAAATVATTQSAGDADTTTAADESALREYNVAKKSERLFGVAFHNRYLFALDQ